MELFPLPDKISKCQEYQLVLSAYKDIHCNLIESKTKMEQYKKLSIIHII